MVHTDNRYVRIGRIGKAHGLKGFSKLIPETSRSEIFTVENQIFYLQNRRGDLIPARVESLRVESKRNTRSFFVKFDQIEDRSQAELFQDTEVYVDRSTTNFSLDEESDVEDIIGFQVDDETGVNGIVQNVTESPAHFIIEIESESRLLRIPWVDVFVKSIDMDNKIVYCRNLDQFLEL